MVSMAKEAVVGKGKGQGQGQEGATAAEKGWGVVWCGVAWCSLHLFCERAVWSSLKCQQHSWCADRAGHLGTHSRYDACLTWWLCVCMQGSMLGGLTGVVSSATGGVVSDCMRVHLHHRTS